MKKMTFLACAAMLTSAIAFTGCNSEQNAPEKQAEVVKTQFSIALPNQLSNGARRMPKGSVLKDGLTDFTGMKDIILVPFAKQGVPGSGDVRLSTNIALDAFMQASEPLITSANAKLYDDVAIPLSTGSFMFYAQANVDQSDAAAKFNVGSIVPSDLTLEPSTFTFNLEPIQGANYVNALAASQSGGKLLAYLNSVASAEDAAHKKWYEYTDADNAAMKAMFDSAYSQLKYLSSFGVARVMSDLYKSLEPLAASNTLAANIRTAINNATYVDNITSNVVTLQAAINNFPGDINLPDGAISIAWNKTDHAFEEGIYPNMTDPAKFTYPAALWYFVASPIKTSNTSKQTMYDGVNNWTTILAAHKDAVSVNSRTRAVAIQELIQFAVARLDVTVKLAQATMVDNSDRATGVATNVDCTAGFPVTAVFVGGQQAVDYSFTSTAAGTEYTIYDKVMASNTMKATTAASAVNHTLVLANGTQKVRVAVELQNEIEDFFGFENQLIPLHGKFYVVAELDPTTIAAASDKTNGHVFKQDFTTLANLTLGNLRKAYSTLPDLRTPQLELGFSVDLNWQEGNTYNVNFE